MRKNWPTVLTIAILASSFLIATRILQGELVDLLTVFLEPFLEIAVAIFFLVALVWSFVAVIRKVVRRQTDRYVFASLGVCILALTIVWFVPFNSLMLKANFRIHLKRRTQVASEIVMGKWESRITKRGGRGNWISLPASDKGLSDEGEVDVWKEGNQTLILFITFRGILDSFSGFVYSSNDEPPKPDAFLGKPIQVEHWAPHWYWYASRN